MHRRKINPAEIPGILDEIVTRNVRWPGWSMTAGAVEDETAQDEGDGAKDDGKDDAAGDGKDDEGEDKPLGPAGQKAYEAEKAKRREANKALREYKELGLTPAQIKEIVAKNTSDGGKGQPDKIDVEQIKADARAEVEKASRDERVSDKIEAKARGFADPEDAVAILLRSHDIEDFLDDDGKIDTEEIESALSELLKNKPHLAAQSGKRFQGGADGGTRKGSKPNQLTREDLKGMSPAAIKKAKDEGRLNDALGIK